MTYYVRVFLLIIVLFFIGNAWSIPTEVRNEIMTGTVNVHKGNCNWQGGKLPCKIYYRESDETTYLILYTNDTTTVTNVVKVVDTKEHMLYANPLFNI